MKRRASQIVLSSALFAGFALSPGAAFAQSNGKEAEAPPRPRMLLVFAPDPDNTLLKGEYDKLQDAQGDIDANDIDIIYIIGDRRVRMPGPDGGSTDAPNLRKRYHIDAGGFRLVLIGHDGLEKARWSEVIEPKEIISYSHELQTKKADPPK